MIKLDEAKTYLRVDSSDEDALIKGLIDQSMDLVAKAARVEDVDALDDMMDDSPSVKVAVYYALAYIYEHREEADMNGLTLNLRSLLFGVREAAF